MKRVTRRHSLRLPVIASLLCSAALIVPAHPAGAARVADQAPVTLKILEWNNPPAVAAVSKLNDAFMAKYPNINVEYTTISTSNYPQVEQARIAANDVDIFSDFALIGSPAAWTPGALKPKWQQYIDAGLYLDLSGQPFVKNYLPNAIRDASTYKGRVYSVTTGSYAFNGMFYNKAIFAKYHLAVPTTFTQLQRVVSTLKAKGVVPFTVDGKDGWPLGPAGVNAIDALYPNPVALDKGLWTGSIKFTDPKSVEVLRRAQFLWQNMDRNFQGIDGPTAIGRFANGVAAMYPAGMWDAPQIVKANPSLQFGYTPVPFADAAADNAGYAGKYDLSWFVSGRSKVKDAALKWLSFFSQKDNYAAYVNATGILPSQANVPLTDPFLKALAPAASRLRLSFDQVAHTPPNAGKYAGFAYPALSPAGDQPDPAKLAQLEQSDWNAAVSAARKAAGSR